MRNVSKYSHFRQVIVLGALAVLTAVGLGKASPVQAAETKPEFTVVKGADPANALLKNVGYFYLKAAPGSKTNLQFTVHNTSNKAITVKATAVDAKTSDSGQLNITTDERNKDNTLKYHMADLLTLPSPTFKVPAKGFKQVDVTLNAPGASFNGLIAGGMVFTLAGDSAASSKDSVAVVNKLAYAYAIYLRNTTAVPPVKTALLDVQPKVAAANTGITLPVQNQAALFLNDVTLDAYVTKKASTTKLYQTSGKHMRIAPNSTLNYFFSFKQATLKAGSYTLHLTVKSKGNPDYQVDRDFKITEAAVASNKAVVYNSTESSKGGIHPIWYFFGGFVLIFAVFIVVIMKIKRV